MIEIEFIKPRPELQRYVRYYYKLICDEPTQHLTFPLGSPQIIFHKKSPLSIPEFGITQDRFTISGQVDFPSHIASDGNTETIVSVFYPYTLAHFIDTPLSELRNLEISGFDLGTTTLNRLAIQILNCSDDFLCINLIEQYLLSKLPITQDVNHARLEVCLNLLKESPSTSINILAEKCCLSTKQFERVFGNKIGMSPKVYAKIVRFQKTLWMMQKGIRDFTDISYSAGYSDQSHFNREFRRYSGVTPTELLVMQPAYSDLFCQPV